MKVSLIGEPDLEFAGGARHIDPRTGIWNYGPADAPSAGGRIIRAGIIGTKESIEGVRRWLDRCRGPIEAKQSHLSHLFLPFPGFDASVGFRSTLVLDSRLERPIPKRDLVGLAGLKPPDAIMRAVDLYNTELQALNEEARCDVVIVCRPDNLLDGEKPVEDPARPWKEPRRNPLELDFHELLKARSLLTSRPIQLIRRETWDPTFRPANRDQRRPLQDEATRAWNLHTALYYKAGGVPWRMAREASEPTNCYVGVSFYRSTDKRTLQTAVAQVFNERGDGVIVRGAQATRSKHDRDPHLTGDGANELLAQSLARYRSEHRNLPARVALHKTSAFTPDELEGFRAAAAAERIDQLDLLWIPRDDPTRLFRQGDQPPLRGTLLSLTATRHALYTRGAVPYYKTYPGMYVPHALPFRMVDVESSPERTAAELMALSKMNWNATQLDGKLPITVRAADSIGGILKHVSDDDRPAPRYAFYM